MQSRPFVFATLTLVASFHMMHTVASATVMLTSPTIVQTVSSPQQPQKPAVDTAANKKCPPADEQNVYRQDKPKNSPFQEGNKTLMNLYGKPCETVVTNVKTSGYCEAADKCKATKTDGKEPKTCKEAGTCPPGGNQGKPEEKGKGEGGQPPQMPQLPQPKGDEPKPKQQTPQPDQGLLGRGGTTSPFLTDRAIPDIPASDRTPTTTAQWQPYTTTPTPETSPFTHALENIRTHTAPVAAPVAPVPRAPEPTPEDRRQTFTEKQPIIPEVPAPTRSNIQPRADERYNIPPSDDNATGFAKPDKPQEFRPAITGAEPTQVAVTENPPQNDQARLPHLIAQLRQLVDKLAQAQREEQENKPAPSMWESARIAPASEIRRIDNMGPAEMIRALRWYGGLDGKAFETLSYVICNGDMSKCTTLMADDGATDISRAVEMRMQNEAAKVAAEIPDTRYIFVGHDHPVPVMMEGYRLRNADLLPEVEASLKDPTLALLGPSGYSDLNIYFSKFPELKNGPTLTVVGLVVEAGGSWIGVNPDAYVTGRLNDDLTRARTDLFITAQSSDPSVREAGREAFTAFLESRLKMSVAFIPNDAQNAAIAESARRVVSNRN